MTQIPGHLFVVHGKLQDVAYDAVVIPTDSGFNVEKHWADVTGEQSPEQPPNWKGGGFGRSGESRVWYVDVTDDGCVTEEVVLAKRAAELIGAIAMDLPAEPNSRRPKQLIALPLLASGLGGQGAGCVVRHLIHELERAAAEHHIDLALCVLKRDRFEAIQYQRRRLRRKNPCGYDEVGQKLGRLAKADALALMIGAGVSMAAGLPSWGELLSALAERVPASKAHLVSDESFQRLPALDQAELLSSLLGDDFAQAIAQLVERVQKPSLAHFLLAGLRCSQVATTNYDLLYENAYKSQSSQTPAALPREVPAPGAPWILKLHGDVRDQGRIVLSRRSFIRYDAEQGPAGALFQSMLMTRHVLFVGLSFTDDNLLRLTHEVADFVGSTSTLGSVVTLGNDPVREQLWERHLAWQGVDAPRELDLTGLSEGLLLRWRARELEILLDSIAVWGTPDDGVYLDPIFGDLLDDHGKHAAKARQAWEQFRGTQPSRP